MADMMTLLGAAAQGARDRRLAPVMLEARKIKSADEIALLDQAAGIVDAVYEEIYRMLRPGVHENEVVAAAQQLLFELGSEHVEAINAVSGDRCNPHPHIVLRPAAAARATRRSSTSSTRSWATGPATTARSTSARDLRPSSTRTSSAASGSTTRSSSCGPGVTTDEIAAVWPTAEEIGIPSDERAASACSSGTGSASASTSRR